MIYISYSYQAHPASSFRLLTGRLRLTSMIISGIPSSYFKLAPQQILILILIYLLLLQAIYQVYLNVDPTVFEAEIVVFAADLELSIRHIHCLPHHLLHFLLRIIIIIVVTGVGHGIERLLRLRISIRMSRLLFGHLFHLFVIIFKIAMMLLHSFLLSIKVIANSQHL